MITGEYKNTVDEKGRVLIPSKIRTEIKGNLLILTRGVEKCLWLFTPEEWEKISHILLNSKNLFDPKIRLLQRRIVAPAQECEIDKAGRINIPPTLRESIGLTKEAVILGIERSMEIWDEATYQEYLAESDKDFKDAAEELGEIMQV